jgi:hypothetical protein
MWSETCQSRSKRGPEIQIGVQYTGEDAVTGSRQALDRASHEVNSTSRKYCQAVCSESKQGREEKLNLDETIVLSS